LFVATPLYVILRKNIIKLIGLSIGLVLLIRNIPNYRAKRNKGKELEFFAKPKLKKSSYFEKSKNSFKNKTYVKLSFLFVQKKPLKIFFFKSQYTKVNFYFSINLEKKIIKSYSGFPFFYEEMWLTRL
jgi:hypothetical protein